MPNNKETFLSSVDEHKNSSSTRKNRSRSGTIITRASVFLMLTAVTVLLFVEASRMGLGAVPVSSMWGRAVWMFSGMALGAMLFPGILRSLALSGGDNSWEKHSHTIVAMVLACLATSALFAYGNEITEYFTPNPDFSHIAVFHADSS